VPETGRQVHRPPCQEQRSQRETKENSDLPDPAIEKYVLKPLKRYLRFVAIQNVEDRKEQPLVLDDFDGPEIEADDD
jgi:hypothetical protein